MVFDYQKEFDEPQVSDGPKVISKESVDFIVIQGILMITKSSMIQREFQLEVWALIIQSSTVIPPSLIILFLMGE